MNTHRFLSYFLTFLVIHCLTLSCKKTLTEPETVVETVQTPEYKLTVKDIESIKYTDYALSNEAESAVRDWVKFHELTTQIEALKKADLSFFKDDKTILQSYLTDLKNEIPEKLNENSIIVRLVALETSIYKLEGIAIVPEAGKEELLQSIRDVLVSHVNLIFQINKKLEKDGQNIIRPN